MDFSWLDRTIDGIWVPGSGSGRKGWGWEKDGMAWGDNLDKWVGLRFFTLVEFGEGLFGRDIGILVDWIGILAVWMDLFVMVHFILAIK